LSFSKVLREVLEEDDGLVLHLCAYERMIAASPEPGGWTAGLGERIQKRSRMILEGVSAFFALARRRSG